PAHGTWWVESSVPIETRATMREVADPLRAGANVDFQNGLAGKQVTIHFRDGQIPPATGKVEAVEAPKDQRVWSRSFEQTGYYWDRSSTPQPSAPQGRFLVLQTENGRIFADSSLIAYMKVESKDEITGKHREPVLLVTAGKELEKPASVFVTYLAKGLSWAPSYRVDIAAPKTLSIEQTAVIKNELASIEGAEVQLISGFPSMQFAHVTSPLSLRTNWSTFFQQLGQRPTLMHSRMGDVVAQQAVMANAPFPGVMDLGAVPSGEGVDMHYQSIGPRTLKEGDSLALSIAKETAPYERIVEWLISDTRDEYGHYAEGYRRQQDAEQYEDAAWDAVRFKNPFKFPMTTAAATVVSGNRFNGQQMAYWVNSGEETSVRVTKALSLRKRHTELEEPGQRDEVFLGAQRYQKTVVKGELAVNNHRKEDVTMVVRRRFSGELISADGEPKKTLREEGAYSVNPRNELTWTFVLKPGEEKALTYRYSLLVRR
ncbi:MAG: hypothetical protein ABSE73_14275, partial [Planctomycetota bacterium]